MFAVVVYRMQVVDDGGIAEQLRQDVSSNQLVGYLLEEVLLVLVDFI